MFRDGDICQDCCTAFEQAFEGEPPKSLTPLDLGRYGSQMFPWERMTIQPRLIRFSPVWLAVALLLVVFILLLALMRTPLPSCWEISS
jgi:hypothetical protein